MNTEPTSEYVAPPTAATIEKFLRATAFEYTDDAWWREDDEGNLRIFIMCNDIFHWACADLEEVTNESVDALVQTVRECEAIVGKYNAYYACILWVARKRGMRPQGAVFKNLEEPLRALFEAAGPPRGIDLGNPQSQEGEYLYKPPSRDGDGDE